MNFKLKKFFLYFKYIFGSNLRNRIILIVLFSITIPTILFIVYIYVVVNDNLYANYVDSIISQSTDHIEDSIVANLRIIENSLYLITSNQNIRENLYELKKTKKNNLSYYKEQLIKLNLETELKYIMGTDFAFNQNLIKSVVLISDPDHYYYVLSNYLPNETLINNTLNFYITDYTVDDSVKYYKAHNTIYYMESITDNITNEELGKIVIGIDLGVLNGEYKLIDDKNGFAAIFDKNGIYRFHTIPSLIGTKANEASISHSYFTNTTEVAIDDEKYLVQAEYIKDLGLYILNYVPVNYFTKDFWTILPIYFYFVLLSIFISMLVGIYAVSHVTEPLKKITKTIKDISEKDFKEKMPSYKYKELNDLSIVYNKMIDKIQYLFTEVYEKQLLVRETELKALHAQINPHFIFNVLETVTWEARISENEKIEQMITALAQLLRTNISFTDQEKYTIDQELEYVSFYLYLQTIRFSERLSYHIEFDSDELLEYYLPKFSIQTLVENCILHGIEGKTGPSHINIKLKTIDNDLFITVEDDGIGFKTDLLNLEDKKNIFTNCKKHIGLKNVSQRIKLLYGNNYGIKIDSKIGKGTIATIHIPIDKEK